MSMKEIQALLIEDNPIHALLIKKLLENVEGRQFEVKTAGNLASGIEQLQQAEVDVILLDLVLPDSQELDTYFAMRAEAADLPIVILTGIDDVTLATRSVEAGAQNFMVKTELDSETLGRAIRNAIDVTHPG